jgi:TP901 family phage tail tape measure protein
VANGAVRSISVRLLAEVGNYVHGFQRARAATSDLIGELSKSEQQRQNMTRLGASLVVAGAGIAAGIGLATKAAIDWESAWAGVVKTVDGSEAQLGLLEEELREMARSLPATHGEIAAVAEAAGQLGVATEDVSEFTRVMIDLGESTNLTADEAATAIAQLMNVMGTAPENVDRLGAALVELGNNGASTEAEIIQMAQRISGAGAIVGASEADVLSLANALASAGINAEAGGSAISRVLVSIASAAAEGGEELAGFARVAGVSADEFAAHFATDPVAALNTFVLGLGRMNAAGEDVFGTLDELGLAEVRTRDALLRLSSSGDLLTQSLEDGARAWGENTALTDEASRRYETAASRIQVAQNQLTDFAITMGAVFLPVVADTADKLGSFVEFLGGMPEPLRQVAGVTAAVAAGLALLGGASLLAVPRIAATKAALDQLAASGGRAAAAVGLLRGSLRAAAFALGPVAAAIAVVELASAGLENVLFDDLNPQIDAMTAGLQRFNETGRATGELARVLGGDLRGTGDELERILDDRVWDQASRGIQDALGRLPVTFGDTMGRVARDLDAPREKVEALDQALSAMARGGNIQEAEEAFAALTAEMGLSEHQTRLLRDMLDGWAAAAEVGAAQADETADGMAEIGGAAQDAATDVEALNEAFEDLLDIQLSFDRSIIGWQQAFADLTEQLDEGSDAMGTNTQAGRDNRSAVLDTIEAIGEMRQAMIDEGAAIEDANRVYLEQLDRLEEVLIANGLNEDAVRTLIDAYRDIPANTAAAVETPGLDAALVKLDRLRRGIDTMPRDLDINVSLSQSGSAPVLGGRVAFAHGGVVAARSGRLVPAHVATSPTVLFGERATGVEAFIPRDGISAERGLAIADVAAGWHGGRVVAPWQWHGQRPAGGDGGTGMGGGQFTGALYLDSGEFLGMVRGEVRQGQAAHDRELLRGIGQGVGAAP